jgi:polysaccharide chain length determinant protein (PEP-CTERM system associated)
VAHRSQERVDRSTSVDLALEIWSRRKWLALMTFIAVVGAIGSMAISLPNLYRAKATVLVGRQQVSEAFVRPSVTAELETRIQTIKEEVMSRARLSELIARFDLYADARKRRPIDALVERMRRDVQLEIKGAESPLTGRGATISFAVAYSSRDPRTAANVANALAELYVEGNTKTREGQAAQTAAFLKRQLDDAKKELDVQERRANDFRLSHMGELPQQVETNLAAMERLNTQLRLNGENQLRAMERHDSLERQLAEAVQPAAPPPAPSPEVERLTKLKHQLDELRSRFSDEYPDVVHVKSEIRALERQIPREAPPSAESAPPDARQHLRQSLGDLDAELRGLKEEERVMRETLSRYEQRVENAPKRQEEIQDLTRDFQSTKERYDGLLKRYEEAQLADSLEQGQHVEQFRILDPAIPPREPEAPNRLRLLIVAFVLGIGLAGAAALAAEKINSTFHSIDDLRAFVTTPTVARVPLILTAAQVRRQRVRAVLTTLSAVVALLLIVAGSHYFASGNEQIVQMMARGNRS